MLGLYDRHKPKFARQYLDGADQIRGALQRYVHDVRNASFPSAQETFNISDEQFERFLAGRICAERNQMEPDAQDKKEELRQEVIKLQAQLAMMTEIALVGAPAPDPRRIRRAAPKQPAAATPFRRYESVGSYQLE